MLHVTRRKKCTGARYTFRDFLRIFLSPVLRISRRFAEPRFDCSIVSGPATERPPGIAQASRWRPHYCSLPGTSTQHWARTQSLTQCDSNCRSNCNAHCDTIRLRPMADHLPQDTCDTCTLQLRQCSIDLGDILCRDQGRMRTEKASAASFANH